MMHSTDPIDAFRHLASDLRNFGGDFVFGDGATIIAASKVSYVGGFGALPDF